jgi:hypothetical protein
VIITVLLLVHGLLAVALLGALTHQSLSVVPPRASTGSRSFLDRFRGVHTPAFTKAIIVLFVATAIGGSLLYPTYRLDIRTTLEDLQLRAANGIFEIKEHLVAVGLGLLPAYAFFWRMPLVPEYAVVRRSLTWILAFVVWWSYLVGHILNNIKGFFS